MTKSPTSYSNFPALFSNRNNFLLKDQFLDLANLYDQTKFEDLGIRTLEEYWLHLIIQTLSQVGCEVVHQIPSRGGYNWLLNVQPCYRRNVHYIKNNDQHA
ncbi:hypothetical protein BpHYR1_021575, partial [Brachionus plicatilis]